MPHAPKFLLFMRLAIRDFAAPTPGFFRCPLSRFAAIADKAIGLIDFGGRLFYDFRGSFHLLDILLGEQRRPPHDADLRAPHELHLPATSFELRARACHLTRPSSEHSLSAVSARPAPTTPPD